MIFRFGTLRRAVSRCWSEKKKKKIKLDMGEMEGQMECCIFPKSID
jgi:hypothetical protein